MSYRYEMTFSDLEELLSNPAGIAIAGMGLLVAFVVLACFVVMYVFQSIGLYTIAKRRGIANPGLAWVPVAYSWILGSVSDQYQYVVRGKVCNRRKILLGLAIFGEAVTPRRVIGAVIIICGIVLFVRADNEGEGGK